ncbi:MAG: hypothetical protein GC158_14325 [Cyanobacteria bacterium RI_101]|jgi:hypothetical protein|nr:hypothetical protein [Cyanobacteria bacterium RI_101]
MESPPSLLLRQALGLILKVLLPSLILALALKYLAPRWTWEATTANALWGVLTAPGVVVLMLMWLQIRGED